MVSRFVTCTTENSTNIMVNFTFNQHFIIRPADGSAAPAQESMFVPALAPPPLATNVAFADTAPRFNPFDRPPDELDATAEEGEFYH